MQRWLIGCTVALGIVLIAPPDASAAAACADPPEEIGNFQPSVEATAAPQTPFFDETDNAQTFAAFKDQGLIVNFWATWCAPCVEEMPALDRLARGIDGTGLHVLALSADRNGAGVVREFYNVNGIAELGVYIDRKMQVSRGLGVRGLPTTVLFNADGHEVGRVVGIAEWDAPATIAFLRSCLGQPPA